jgi:hypothetical protein
MASDTKSVFGLMIDTEKPDIFHDHFRANDDTRGFYLNQLIDRAKHTIRNRSGELGPRIWNKKEVVDKLQHFVKDKKGIVEFTFTKHVDNDNATEKQVIEKLRIENPLLVDLATKYPNNVKLYFIKNRVSQHYQVNDNDDIIFEENGHTEKEGTKWVDVVFNHEDLASKWIKRFDNSLSNLDKMEIHFA